MVNQLRKKIEPDPANRRFIRTELWIGYRFVLPQESRSRSNTDNFVNLSAWLLVKGLTKKFTYKIVMAQSEQSK